MRTRLTVLLLALGLFLSGDVVAEPRTQADLRIARIQASLNESGFGCTVEVLNYHEDRARNVALRILLPVGVRVALMPPACTAGAPADDGTVGVVSCALGSIPVGRRAAASVVTTIPPPAVRHSCGALVWSTTPDPDPTNNQAAAHVPRGAQASAGN